MKDKFKDIPVEKDTIILSSSEMKFDEYDVVYQIWSWDGLYAESVIFLNEDIKTLNEEKIKSDIKKTNLVSEDSELTYKKGEKYTFVNFNFRTED